jgi:hypothetical protein
MALTSRSRNRLRETAAAATTIVNSQAPGAWLLLVLYDALAHTGLLGRVSIARSRQRRAPPPAQLPSTLIPTRPSQARDQFSECAQDSTTAGSGSGQAQLPARRRQPPCSGARARPPSRCRTERRRKRRSMRIFFSAERAQPPEHTGCYRQYPTASAKQRAPRLSLRVEE